LNKNIKESWGSICSIEETTSIIETIFTNQVQILKFYNSEIKNKQIHIQGNFGIEKCNIIGGGSYGHVAYLGVDSKILSNSALKMINIHQTTHRSKRLQIINWIIEHIIQHALSKSYYNSTHSEECGFASIQYAISSLFFISVCKNSLLSGMFILHRSSGFFVDDMILQIATVLQYIHSNSTYLGFQFMHRDLHFQNIMSFKTKQKIEIPFMYDKHTTQFKIIQDIRRSHTHKICFKPNKKGQYDRYTLIDFGLSWLSLNDCNNQISTIGNIYATRHDFNDQHDLRQLIVSLYISFCVDFDINNGIYTLNTNHIDLNHIIYNASMTSARFQLCTDPKIMTLIHRFVHMNRQYGINDYKNMKHFKEHVSEIHSILNHRETTVEHTSIRMNDLYKTMFNEFIKTPNCQRLDFYHLMYAFMIEHHATPIFKPSNLIEHMLLNRIKQPITYSIIKNINI
jgi:hypothetical protein